MLPGKASTRLRFKATDSPIFVLEELQNIPTVGSFVASNIRDAAAAIGVFEWSDTWHGQQEGVELRDIQ